jgi:uncharacterized protein YkwD
MQNTLTLQPSNYVLPTEKVIVGILVIPVAIVILGFSVLSQPISAIDLPTQDEQTLIELTNQERVKQGIHRLTYNPQLQAAAEAKAKDMLDRDYFDHIAPGGKTPWNFIDQTGYSYTKAGENLAIDFKNVAGPIPAWMDSPTHRANILKAEYKEIGIARMKGEFQGRETVVVVQMFGAKSFTIASVGQSVTKAVATISPIK